MFELIVQDGKANIVPLTNMEEAKHFLLTQVGGARCSKFRIGDTWLQWGYSGPTDQFYRVGSPAVGAETKEFRCNEWPQAVDHFCALAEQDQEGPF